MEAKAPYGWEMCLGCAGQGYTVEGTAPIAINGVVKDCSRRVPCDLCEGRGRVPRMQPAQPQRPQWRSPSLRRATEALERENALEGDRPRPSPELTR